jgi:hypothetical protein
MEALSLACCSEGSDMLNGELFSLENGYGPRKPDLLIEGGRDAQGLGATRFR